MHNSFVIVKSLILLGELLNEHCPSVSKDATSNFVAEFFAPLTFTLPDNGFPPLIKNRELLDESNL